MIADLSGAISMMGSLFGGDTDSSAPKQLLLAPGPRMAGTYTSAGGLKIQFQDAGAVIDCAQAHVSVQYDVSNRAGAANDRREEREHAIQPHASAQRHFDWRGHGHN